MPYNPKKDKRFSVELPLPVYKRLMGLAKKLDRSVANTARGLIMGKLSMDGE